MLLLLGQVEEWGRATILKLLSEGYFVIGLDIINNDDVKNYKYQQFKCDITNELEVISVFNQVCTITDRIDGIINLAGKYTMNSLVEIDYIKFEEIFKINFFGCFFFY